MMAAVRIKNLHCQRICLFCQIYRGARQIFPSFSKFIFGGFVRFQRVARKKNEKINLLCAIVRCLLRDPRTYRQTEDQPRRLSIRKAKTSRKNFRMTASYFAYPKDYVADFSSKAFFFEQGRQGASPPHEIGEGDRA
jgi:hypothetical protein